MASTKNITMRQFNGIDYDTLYPKTKAEQILGALPITSGGTGATTASGAIDTLISALSTITPAAEDLIALKDANGTSGSTTLTALATLMSSLGGGAKIQTGSYVGTGTYGSSNPCTLTFDFVPSLIIIAGTGYVNSGNVGLRDSAIIFYGAKQFSLGTASYSASSSATNSVTWLNNGKSISWYAAYNSSYNDYMAEVQLNSMYSNRSPYYYIALS